MRRWILNIVLALVFIPIATLGLVISHHALADIPPDIHLASSLPSGSSSWSLEHDGQVRTFRIYVPASLDRNTARPLVVMLHGRYGSGKQAEMGYGWNAHAEIEGFVVLYPDGVHRTWNAGSCCGYAGRNDIDDVGFITAAVDQVGSKISIDQSRIFATGISNGGRMTYRLACETNLFAAIAPVAATLMVPCESPEPISVMHIHGLEDRLIRFDGGSGIGMGEVDGPAVPEVISGWQAVDGCDTADVTVAGAISTETSNCVDGESVVLVILADAGHEWPRSPEFDSTSEIWSFFAAHPGK